MLDSYKHMVKEKPLKLFMVKDKLKPLKLLIDSCDDNHEAFNIICDCYDMLCIKIPDDLLVTTSDLMDLKDDVLMELRYRNDEAVRNIVDQFDIQIQKRFEKFYFDLNYEIMNK